jgi:hypothetical protein
MITRYKSHTNNGPELDFSAIFESADRPELKAWGEPTWEIYVDHDGNVEVWACRPTYAEVCEGDLLGNLGSIIKVPVVNRTAIKNALSIARVLCKCHPDDGAFIKAERLYGIGHIQSEITIYSCQSL